MFWIKMGMAEARRQGKTFGRNGKVLAEKHKAQANVYAEPSAQGYFHHSRIEKAHIRETRCEDEQAGNHREKWRQVLYEVRGI
ncbi:hypothetical protein OAE86_00400 [Akkermansiaceae bacterium]|nr:hypothetical protein [bacterium]MDB4665913.1 hypothetical protein [Akkermansiaceae bacterium]